jgi:hypothetical protein
MDVRLLFDMFYLYAKISELALAAISDLKMSLDVP